MYIVIVAKIVATGAYLAVFVGAIIAVSSEIIDLIVSGPPKIIEGAQCKQVDEVWVKMTKKEIYAEKEKKMR